MEMKLSRTDWLRVGQAMDWLKSAEDDGLIPPDVLRDMRRGKIRVNIVDGDAKPPEGSLVNMEPKSIGPEDLGDEDFETLLGGPDGVRAELRDALNRASRGRRDGRHGERRR